MSSASADDTRKAQQWRGLAAEARIHANAMSDPAGRATMLSIAEAYVRLAERAEQRDAGHVIEVASFDPDALKVIGQAFDVAWAEIAANFSDV